MVRKVKSFSLVPETNFHMPQPIIIIGLFFTHLSKESKKKNHLETKHFGILTIRQVGVSNHALGKQCISGHQILLPSIRMVDEIFATWVKKSQLSFYQLLTKTKLVHMSMSGGDYTYLPILSNNAHFIFQPIMTVIILLKASSTVQTKDDNKNNTVVKFTKFHATDKSK